jgi:pimeloyl-ACP methyl ester carboxylesterase
MPLLYYPARMLSARGADVLRVDYDYRHTGPEARGGAFAADVAATWEAGLAARPYERVTLIGKSLGTLALGQLLATVPNPPPMRSLWLTPLFRDARLRAQAMAIRQPAFFAAGTADPHYDAEALAAVQEATGGEALVIEGANHSLEIEGDVGGSIRILERVMRAIEAFIR